LNARIAPVNSISKLSFSASSVRRFRRRFNVFARTFLSFTFFSLRIPLFFRGVLVVFLSLEFVQLGLKLPAFSRHRRRVALMFGDALL
jgi:hypothetical protein